jgi:hypothetical protein
MFPLLLFCPTLIPGPLISGMTVSLGRVQEAQRSHLGWGICLQALVPLAPLTVQGLWAWDTALPMAHRC